MIANSLGSRLRWKGIVQFTVVNRSRQGSGGELGIPMVVDMAKLERPGPQNGCSNFDKADPRNPDHGPAICAPTPRRIHYYKTDKEEQR